VLFFFFLQGVRGEEGFGGLQGPQGMAVCVLKFIILLLFFILLQLFYNRS